MRRTLLFVLVLLATALPAAAQPFPRKDVPQALQPWIPWALDGHEESLCPVVNGSAVCYWPGRLVLVATASGATFTQEIVTDRNLLAPLLGKGASWPHDVKLDGQAVSLVEKDERPHVWLVPGSHKVEGRFTWKAMPDSLPLPALTALVDLTVEGKRVAFPGREDDLLLLQQDRTAEGEEDALRLKVFRKIDDGIPLWLETRLQLEISGKAREVQLTGALPEGLVPAAVWGELPARLDRDGTLRLQARAGKFTVSVRGRYTGAPTEFGPPKAQAPWPAQEIWVFASNELIRQSEMSGGVAVDPSRTDLPQEWRGFPAFLMDPEAKLKLRETRRGEPEPSPDRLTLHRRLWLDLDGSSFTVQDDFAGTLGKTSRLNLLSGTLGRAAVNGQDQLITADPKTKKPGVELRKTDVSLRADGRLARDGARVSAVGWDVNVQGLGLELHLPPGWRLFAAPGADSAPGAWTARWTLFGFFFVLLVSLGAGKLVSRPTGLLALVTLTLTYREHEAPEFVWISLLAATAVLGYFGSRPDEEVGEDTLPVRKRKVLPVLVKVWWGVSLLVLTLLALPFFVHQIRSGLYPQTATGPVSVMGGETGGMFLAKTAAPQAPRAAEEAPAPVSEMNAVNAPALGLASAPEPKVARKKASKLDYQSNVLASKSQQQVQFREYEQDPNAIVQTGAGIPTWTFGSDSVSWSGPVASTEQVTLLLVSPALNLLLAVLRILLVTALALQILRRARPALGAAPKGPGLLGKAAALLVLLVPTLPALSQELPSQELLDELRTRLTRPVPCSPNCLTTPDLAITIDKSELKITAEVHALAPGAWALPGPAATWVPRTILVDQKPGAGLIRLDNGFLYLRLTPGVHKVEIAGPLPDRDSLALQLQDRPKRARAQAPGWQVDGIREDGASEGSVQLSRQLKQKGEGKDLADATYEPWFEVTRVLDIGVSWRVETQIHRVTPAGAPAVLKVPLLKGMLATGEQEVKDGEVVVTFGRDQLDAEWSSTLKPVEGETLTMKAPEGRAWSEVWIVRTSPLWQATAKGLPPVKRQEGGEQLAEYRPWPGESLDLVFQRPAGVPGQTLTIDSVTLDAQPGKRLLDATLTLQVRASRTTPLALTIPTGAEIQSLTIAGQKKPVRPEGGKLTLTIDPGQHPVVVSWREGHGMSVVQAAPRVTLGQPAVNALVTVQIPPERWVLYAGGPSWGPAILFWGELLIILLCAVLLGRLSWSPLRTWQWVLLALGIAPLPSLIIALVAGWFLVFALRERSSPEHPVVHNLVQIALVFWTLLFVAFLYGAVHQGLLARPDMDVSGNGSTETSLRWYVDRIQGQTPEAWVLTLPLWIYKIAMLLWALWLASSLIRWMGWGFRALTKGGGWRKMRHDAPPPPPGPPAPPPPPPPSGIPAPTPAPSGEIPPVIGDPAT